MIREFFLELFGFTFFMVSIIATITVIGAAAGAL